MALFVKNGRFPYRDPARATMKTGPDGRVSIQPQGQPYLFVALHDQGIAQGSNEELVANPTITLNAWARLEGMVRHDAKPVPNAKLDTYPFRSNGGMKWAFLNFQDRTETDADGKFVFAKLKPGTWRVRLLPVDRSGARRTRNPSSFLPDKRFVSCSVTRADGDAGNAMPGVGRTFPAPNC